MRLAALGLATLALALEAPGCASRAARPAVSAATRTQDTALARARELRAQARAAWTRGEGAAARAQTVEAVDALLADGSGSGDAAHTDALAALGSLAEMVGDNATARRAREHVLEERLRSLPGDDVRVQRAKVELARSIRELGDLASAQSLLEQSLETLSRTVPDDDAYLQAVRLNLATSKHQLGDLHGAKALEEQVLEIYSNTLADDDPDVQAARQLLAVTMKTLGDLQGARVLEEKVLEIRSKALADDDPELQWSRQNLAVTIAELGELEQARTLFEKVLEVRLRTLPDDHPDLQSARQNLAVAMERSGDLAGARTLAEKVLEVCSRNLPDDHPDLQRARAILGVTLTQLGDLQGARVLMEKVVEVQSRTLPDDHPDLQVARQNLAVTMKEQGDLQGARALQEKVLEVCSASLPDDHPHLQAARQNLATTIGELGDIEGARALEEQVLEVCARTLPDEAPDTQTARLNLGVTLFRLGDVAAAREHFEAVLEIRARTLPEDHLFLQHARQNLAEMLALEIARDPDEEKRTRYAELVATLCRTQTRAAREVQLSRPSREAEERCAALTQSLDFALSAARGLGVIAPMPELVGPAFVLSEATRGAAIVSAEQARRAAGSPVYAELRTALARASDELAALAQRGMTQDEYDSALSKRESAERELMAVPLDPSRPHTNGTDLDAASLARSLGERSAAVAFRRFTDGRIEHVDEPGASDHRAFREVPSNRLCAFVVRGATEATSTLPTLVDLGPADEIKRAVQEWRHAIGVGRDRGTSVSADAVDRVRARGEELRRLVLDPLLDALGDARRVVVVPDDVLHLVPLEALPLTESGALAGDRWQFETRATLSELLTSPPEQQGESLIALGGAAFNVEPEGSSSVDNTTTDARDSDEEVSAVRGRRWERQFEPLTHSSDEVRGIGMLYAELFRDERAVRVLEKRQASRGALTELAPHARWLHLATHGWFAPESIRSWSDPRPIDAKSGLGTRESGEDRVKGASPMLLCGLALAGANLPESASGRTPGLITAEEIAALDLSNCELAVLSACDTNVGESRAGQGVASFQRALQMAGARSVITSLWKVPDEATKELMLDFYRRIWVEKKPKSQALWEAKKRLREARDERGEPAYATRDWAAWVLTGEPN